MIWEKLLTDTDGQYVEVQSGRLFNQSAENSIYTPFKHRSFSPYQSDSWTEYWFPVMQTNGFVKANQYGAINLKQENGWLKIYFSPLQTLNDQLEIFENEKKIYSKLISVKPLMVFADSLQISVDEKKLILMLGTDKLIWNSAPEEGNLNRPMQKPSGFDNNSVYGLYLQGKNYISFRDYLKASELLTACLQKDPYYVPALCDMAALQFRRFQYTEAVNTAAKALSVNTYEPAANYYYALANLQLGNITDAKDGFDIAASSAEFRSAAYTQLAKLYFREKNESKAIEYAEKSLVNNQYNLESLQLLALINRLQNKEKKATAILEQINSIDPLNHFARFEKYCWDGAAQSKEKFTGLIQNEIPHQTYLELGIWYHQLNCKDEALKVLSLAAPAAEITYWKAFIDNKSVDVSSIRTGIDFPFRAETATVLEALIKSNSHWLLKYHLALIEWNRNNLTQAKELFEQCGIKPDDASFYAAKSGLFKSGAEDIEMAIKLDPHQWRFYKLLAEYLIGHKEYDKAFAVSSAFYKIHPDNYIMGMLYAKTMLLTKKYAIADDFLTGLKILPFEGATEGRKLFHEAKLMQAIAEYKKKQYKKALQFIAEAKLWPPNLGVGKPYDEEIDERLEEWLSYQCKAGLGMQKDAAVSLQKIIAFSPKVDNTVMNFLPANHLISAWAIEKTAGSEKATEWLDKQIALFPGNKIIQWCLQVYLKKQPDILDEEEKDSELRILEQLTK